MQPTPSPTMGTTTPASLLQGIDTVIIRVSNLEASKAWYGQKLGLKAIWEAPTMLLTVLDSGGSASLTLWQTDKKIQNDEETASYPIFKTPDAAALQQALKERAVPTGELITDDYVISFFFTDPDGNRLEACQVREM